MRIIARRTIIDFWKSKRNTEQPLKAWYDITKKSNWKNPNQLKAHIRDASIISSKRVVFNIKGNDYRLIADIEYTLGIVFIVWIGNHKDYNKINANTISYVKSNQNKKRARSRT